MLQNTEKYEKLSSHNVFHQKKLSIKILDGLGLPMINLGMTYVVVNSP